MGRVHLGAVDPRCLVVRRRASERLDDLADVGGGHRVWDDEAARRGEGGRRERDPLREAARRLASEMDQLADHGRAVPMHRVGARAQRVANSLVPGLDQDPGREAGGRMHGRAAEHDQTHARGGALLLDRDVTGPHPSLLRHTGAHGRLDDPVSEPECADRTRFEEMGIGGFWQPCSLLN